MTDLQSFTLAFLFVWGGLAAYLLWLQSRLSRLEER
jgi:CcmD family protein